MHVRRVSIRLATDQTNTYQEPAGGIHLVRGQVRGTLEFEGGTMSASEAVKQNTAEAEQPTQYHNTDPRFEALLREYVPYGEDFRSFGRAVVTSGTSEHNCPGHVEMWFYFNPTDGKHHVTVTEWWECEQHLEILSDVPLQGVSIH
jgi:hypothetical protein